LTRPFFRKVPDPDMAMFLCRAAAHAAIHEAACERPDLLDNPVFVDEVTTLLERCGSAPRDRRCRYRRPFDRRRPTAGGMTSPHLRTDTKSPRVSGSLGN